MTSHDTPVKSAGIRRANERHLLHLMHDRGVVTQADMATETGLQPSTVFRIFRSLEERAVIQQTSGEEPDQPKQGRRPGYFELNPHAGYSMGVDLSQSMAAILLVDFKGNPVREQTVRVHPGTSAEDVVALILDTIDEVLAFTKIDRSSLLGVGLGAPGVIDIARGEVVRYSRLPGMEGLPIQREFAARFGVPVYIHNNASVIALAENRFGRAAGHESVVAILIRSGIGGAFIKEGQIYTSQRMTAFELGHMTLNVHADSGEGTETLEDILSEGALIARANSAEPRVTDLAGLVACMDSDNSPGCMALESVARAFNEKARNVALMLNPEAFVIVARHRTIAEFFARRLARALEESNRTDRFSVSTVIPLEYDPILACRGAADLVFDGYFVG